MLNSSQAANDISKRECIDRNKREAIAYAYDHFLAIIRLLRERNPYRALQMLKFCKAGMRLPLSADKAVVAKVCILC